MVKVSSKSLFAQIRVLFSQENNEFVSAESKNSQ